MKTNYILFLGLMGIIGGIILIGDYATPKQQPAYEPQDEAVEQPTPMPFYTYVEMASLEHGVDPALVKAMILTEVGPTLPRKPVSYNPKDHGMAQINEILFPQMKEWIGEHFDPYIPEHAVLACIKQIQWLLQRPSINEANVALAYNMGATAVRRGKQPSHISEKHHQRFHLFLTDIRENPSKYVELFNTVKDWEYGM